MAPLSEILTGKTEAHLVDFQHGFKVHAGAFSALKNLQAAARTAGFELDTCSAFRSFAAQLKIWNAKVKGERLVYDAAGKRIELHKLRPQDAVEAIMRWSAVPGASRHHWGTDLDVFDRKRLEPGYLIQLVPQEFEGEGPFTALHDWLDQNMSAYGFFRPYASDRGGVSPERWHISYAPISKDYLEALTPELIHQAIVNEDMEMKNVVILRLPELFPRFIQNVNALT